MKKTLKLIIPAALIIFVLVGYVFGGANISEQLEHFINREGQVNHAIQVIQEQELYNKLVGQIKVNNALGYFIAEKNFTKKNIKSILYGGAIFNSLLLETNRDNYFIVMGENYQNEIAKVKVTMPDSEQMGGVDGENYFMVAFNVNKDIVVEDISFELINQEGRNVRQDLEEENKQYLQGTVYITNDTP